MKYFVLMLMMLFAMPSFATTYYIDFASGSDTNNGTSKSTPWQRSPGMTGFKGQYTHAQGDVFIFKGGVTWTSTALPLTMVNSGGAGNPDKYTVDSSWFTGTSYSAPIFDGASIIGNLIFGSAVSNITINGLKLQNGGQSTAVDSFHALECDDCDQLTISNNILTPFTWLGIYLPATQTGNTHHGIFIFGNDISNVSMGIVVATAAPNAIVDTVQIHDNVIHDFASKIGGGVHGDGIHLWGQPSDNSQFLSNVKIYNNLFYGSFDRTFGTSGGMTAFIFSENATSNILIYNNAGSYTGTPTANLFESMISLGGNPGAGGGHQVFNNSFYGTIPGMSAAILLGKSPNTTIQNNILSGMRFAYFSGDTLSDPGTVIDYNNVGAQEPAMWNNVDTSWAAWQAQGRDRNGVNLDPKYVLPPANLHLQSNSPDVAIGINLSTIFTLDKDGQNRPSLGPWTLGAFANVAGPKPPPAVRLTIR